MGLLDFIINQGVKTGINGYTTTGKKDIAIGRV